MTIFENYAEHFEERMRDILLRYEDGRSHVRGI